MTDAAAAQKTGPQPKDGIYIDRDKAGNPKAEYTIADGKIDGEARF